jgi:hypothetical protein
MADDDNDDDNDDNDDDNFDNSTMIDDDDDADDDDEKHDACTNKASRRHLQQLVTQPEHAVDLLHSLGRRIQGQRAPQQVECCGVCRQVRQRCLVVL